MGDIFIFLLGALVGAVLWQWFGMRMLSYVMRHKPLILRGTLRELSYDAFRQVQKEVEAEEARRKEE